MDRKCKRICGRDFLDIKTGISIYRGIIFIFGIVNLEFIILGLKFNRDILEIIVASILEVIIILIIIFMERITYILHLPTNHLIVSKEIIIFKKRKIIFNHRINECHFTYYSSFNDTIDSCFIPVLIVEVENTRYEIFITRKQYLCMMDYIKK